MGPARISAGITTERPPGEYSMTNTDVDTDEAVDRINQFLREQLTEADAKGYVLGISGGLDSAVGATLAVEAVGADLVTGVVLPDVPSDEQNMEDARTLADRLEIEVRNIPITPVVEEFTSLTPFEVDSQSVGNIRARTRMVFQYIEANVNDLLVLGATNKTELLLGYFTKYGDGAVDVRPMADLYKTEIRDVARVLSLDERFIQKAPTAGLWEGQTDEGELGASYETIDTLLQSLVEEGYPIEEAAQRANLPLEEAKRFERMVTRTEHKRSLPPYPEIPR